MDLMQRFMEIGFCHHRFGELVAWHLRERGYVTGAVGAASGWSMTRMDTQRQ
jgi:hypothetical protein